jgi:hypothetical protein
MSRRNRLLHWPYVIYGHWYYIATSVAAVIVTVYTMRLIFRLLDYRRLCVREKVFLEIVPPFNRDKTPLSTNQLFSILHGLNAARPLLDKLLLRKVVLSTEVISTREGGIRFIVVVDATEVVIFTQNLLSYSPDVRVQEVDDYSKQARPGGMHKTRILNFRQTGHYAYPLKSLSSLNQHDPVAYLTGAMTQLDQGELIAFQIVLSPTVVRQAHRIDKKLLARKEVRRTLRKFNRLYIVTRYLFIVIRIPFFFLRGIINEILYSSDRKSTASIRTHRMMSAAEQELIDSIHYKISQPLYRANIRAVIMTNTKQANVERVKALKTSLASYTAPKYQSIAVSNNLLSHFSNRYRTRIYNNRLPSLFNNHSSILSASEVASLYHFPHSTSAQTENVLKSLSKTLPAPISLKTNETASVILGINKHHGMSTPIGLTANERERHVYIIGGTGNGKTTMVQGAIIQDILSGKGVAVVDPHGDLAETILRHIPTGRIKDVIYFNPYDHDFPIGLNLLELPENISDTELAREKEIVTEAIVSVFRKLFSDDDSGGHRVEYILRNAILTAYTVRDATLFTIYDLLTNQAYQKKIAKTLTDARLKNFWVNEMGKAGAMQQVKISYGVTTKIGRFYSSPSAKASIEQPKSTINFDDIMATNKILICNLAKGRIGEDTSNLFGITILTKLQIAAHRRARLQIADRQPYYLYVDEFQNFATLSFTQILSEARKYKLFLTMAEQSTTQQEEERLVNIILANVGTVVTFRSGSPIDERLMLGLFRPKVEQGEIANLPAYSFYIKINGIKPQEPMSGETILMSNNGSELIAEKVIKSSRNLYALQPKKKDETIVKKSTHAKLIAKQLHSNNDTIESENNEIKLINNAPTKVAE